MKILRESYVRNLLILATGIAFFNMSFFLAELSALKLDKHNRTIASVVKLLTSAGFEEEADGECSPPENEESSEFDIICNTFNKDHFLIVADPLSHTILHDIRVESPHLEISSPPPELG